MESSKKIKAPKYLGIINFFGALIFGLFMLTDGIQHLGMYFLIAIYFWIYILFLFMEIRLIILKNKNVFEHLSSSLIVSIGFIFPIFSFLLSMFLWDK